MKLRLVHSSDTVSEAKQQEHRLDSIQARLEQKDKDIEYIQALNELTEFLKKHPHHVRACVMFETFAPVQLAEKFVKGGILALS